MTKFLVAVLALVAAGCTTVRLEQRDGCWIRQTEKFPKRVTEEIGPCARAEPKWVEDRLTRLVQECTAAADYRWQVRALAAWNRGEPLPPQEPEQNVLQGCMAEATRSMITEHEAMKSRIAELADERARFKDDAQKGTEHLRTSHDRLTTALGEAAKKPAPSAVATATARGDGNATTSSDLQSQASNAAELASKNRGAPVIAKPKPAKVEVVTAPVPPSTGGSGVPAEKVKPADCIIE
ncbi:MAG: hypothetical protein ACK4N5_04405 [Myxococcales bacterium]